MVILPAIPVKIKTHVFQIYLCVTGGNFGSFYMEKKLIFARQYDMIFLYQNIRQGYFSLTLGGFSNE